jgi:hypothetical protein
MMHTVPGPLQSHQLRRAQPISEAYLRFVTTCWQVAGSELLHLCSPESPSGEGGGNCMCMSPGYEGKLWG